MTNGETASDARTCPSIFYLLSSILYPLSFLVLSRFPLTTGGGRGGDRRGRVDRHVDMREPPTNHERHPAGPRHDPLEHRSVVGAGIDDQHPVDVPRPLVLGIGHGTHQHF